MHKVYEETRKGWKINIYADDDFQYGEVCYILHPVKITYKKQSRYTLGTNAITDEEVKRLTRLWEHGKIFAKKVYAYVHSGATISTSPFSCPWDSGQSGIVYIDKEDWERDFHEDMSVDEVLENNVKLFDAWLQGNVFGYAIEDENEKEVESCWGFLQIESYDAKDSYVLNEARCMLDVLRKRDMLGKIPRGEY